MELRAFELQMDRLRIAYGEKVFPKNGEREKVYWERLKYADAHQFSSAVSHLIAESLHAPPLSKVVEAISFFRPTASANSSLPDPGPDNPRAKELAAKYAPEIIAMLRSVGKKLPYDPKKRVNTEAEIEEVDWV